MVAAYQQFTSAEPNSAATEAAIAEAGRTTAFECALDYSKYFQRLVYRASELWQTGELVAAGEGDGELRWALEYAVSMGASPSSQSCARPRTSHPWK